MRPPQNLLTEHPDTCAAMRISHEFSTSSVNRSESVKGAKSEKMEDLSSPGEPKRTVESRESINATGEDD